MKTNYLLPSIILTVGATFIAADEETVDVPWKSKEVHELSCDDIIDITMQSQCAAPVASLLRGAEIDVGLSLSATEVYVSYSDDSGEAARMSGGLSPSPGLRLSLAPSFFGSSHLGYGFGFTYNDTYALDQTITRNGKEKTVDVGTYLTTTMIAGEASLFYMLGDPLTSHLVAGVGLSAGLSALRGKIMITEDKSNSTCYNAGTAVINGASRTLLIDNCSTESFRERSFSLGSNLYIGARYQRFLFVISGTGLVNKAKGYDLNPTYISFDFSYVVPL